MMSYTHTAFGMLCMLLVTYVLRMEITEFYYLGFLALAVGSLLPDIDTPRSFIGRLVFPISRRIELMHGHRTITHSLKFILIIGALGLLVTVVFNLKYAGLGLFVGVVSHIIGDGMTKAGVPLLYPDTRPFYFMPEFVLFRTGSGVEFLFFIFILVAIATISGVGFVGIPSVMNKMMPSYYSAKEKYIKECDGPGLRNLCYVDAYICDEFCGPVYGLVTGLYNGKLVVKSFDSYFVINQYETTSMKLVVKEKVSLSEKVQVFSKSSFFVPQFNHCNNCVVSVSGSVEGNFTCINPRDYSGAVVYKEQSTKSSLVLHSVLVEDVLGMNCSGFVDYGVFTYKIRMKV